MQREASDDELCLGVETYAAAIATTLRHAEGEFCFGLFGRWGMGKSRLARTLEPLLTDPDRYREALKLQEGSDPDHKLRYAVVRHSAWKYRRTPEAWIFLYQSFVRACGDASPVDRLSRTLRTGVERHGVWPLVLGLIGLGLAAVPLGSKLNAVAAAVSLAGGGALLYARGVLARGRDAAVALAKRYATLTSHGDKLGLQALIGDDLRALLVGWVPRHAGASGRRSPDWTPVIALWGFAGVWMSLLLGQGSGIGSALCGLPLLGALGSCEAPRGWGTPWWQHAAFAAWAATCLGVLWLAGRDSGPHDRILLIVDDLDRCAPEEMVELVESLKLLVEDPEISERLQILMLVDEDVLEHAIAHKFRRLIATRAGRAGQGQACGPPGPDRAGLDAARAYVVREHVEKLFACHLRLPDLDDGDVAELAESYAGLDLRKRPEPPEPTPRPEPSEPVAEAVSPPRGPGKGAARLDDPPPAPGPSPERPEQPAPNSVVKPQPVLPQFQESDLRFDRAEVDMLREHLPALMRRDGCRPPTPRAIKLFLFKYQLCRHLLAIQARERGALPPSHEVTFRALAQACFGGGPANENHGRSDLAAVVRQVA